MISIFDSPFAVFFVALIAQCGAAYIGDRLRRNVRPVKKDEREDFNTALTATLTLLAVIIGFSFSMAVSRYDQRKNCEETEANAIGTEYLRADLLPADDAAVVRAAMAQLTPVAALAASGMNDVFNSQGFTQAAWLNRIPVAAWALMGLIAIFSNFLMGYRERSTGMFALLVLPVIASIAFFLIADIDSPHGGVIRVTPHNLISTSQFMRAQL
jgi:hypothetical protein